MSAAADRMRLHREAMELGIREQISLPEAMRRLSRERWQACAARGAQPKAAPTPTKTDNSDRWMMRD